MKTIVLIQCCKTKLSYENKASDIYISPLFKKSLIYAKQLNPQAIHILSAKYGLLDLEIKIQPYNSTLKNMNHRQRKEWADKILKDISNKYDIYKDKFIFLTGIPYREFLIDKIKNYEIPLEGLSIGRQLQKLNSLLINNKKGFGLL
jgi:hypothetical protein